MLPPRVRVRGIFVIPGWAQPLPKGRVSDPTQEENVDAVDNIRNSAGAMAGRIGFELHPRWIHSPAAGLSGNRSRD